MKKSKQWILVATFAFTICIISYAAFLITIYGQTSLVLSSIGNPFMPAFFGVCGLIFLTYSYMELKKENPITLDTNNNKNTGKPLWSLRSWQGLVLQAIIKSEESLTWRELQYATHLEERELNKAIADLRSKEDIFKIQAEGETQGRYKISEVSYRVYSKQFCLQPELFNWIDQWKNLRRLDFSIENGHFFLERRHLNDFSQELIAHAKSSVLISNPFIQICDLTNTLIETKKNGIKVEVITRSPRDNTKYAEGKRECHSTLTREGIHVFYDDKVHAKIIVVDDKIAIVSSLNFFAYSSAGASWEAGLVTIDKEVIKSITRSVSEVFANASKASQEVLP